MSNSIMEMIMGQLSGDALSKVAGKAGVSDGEARQGITAAIPMLLGAMERNTGDSGGAESLKGALERDHDGSILDDVEGFLGNPEQANGAGILKHVLGGKRGGVEQGMSTQTGLNSGAVGKILEMIAPLVMGALGKKQRESGLDVGMLSGFLGGEREMSESGSGMMGMVSGLLDQDGDGDIMDDIGGIAGKLFGKR